MTREEAINEIKSWDFLEGKEIEAIHTLIPELRESKDERIRKTLIEALKTSKTVGELKFIFPEPTREECIAYLEKQKECVADSSKTSAEEDERIRARLIEYFQGFLEGYEDCYKDGGCVKWEGLDVKSILAWLEKQKKTANSFTDGIIEVRSFRRGMEEGRKLETQKEPGIKWLKSDNVKNPDKPYVDKAGMFYTTDGRMCYASEIEQQKEQKSNIELIQKSWYMEGYHDKEFNCEPKWIIKTGEGGPRYEENPKYGQIIKQKPVEYLSKDKVYAIMNKLTELSTSELIPLNSDEYKKINEITSDVRSLLDYPIEEKYDYANEYKKCLEDRDYFIKNHVKVEQKPAEWSEDDKEMLNSCISSIEEAKENRYAHKETDGDTSYDHEIDWLKSLHPQPHWKPSEAQLMALHSVIDDKSDTIGNEQLKLLYEHLKKLGAKEEPEYYQHFDPDC